MTNKKDQKPDPIREKLENAEEVTPADFELYAIPGGKKDDAGGGDRDGVDSRPDAGDGGGFGPNMPAEDIARARECAELDQNDRDNARRLVIWFGPDLVYVAGMGWLTWRGTHWQRDEGELIARLKAQDVVDKIKLEVYAIEPSKGQRGLIALADKAAEKAIEDRTPEENKLIAAATAARGQLAKRRSDRRKFAISSGNANKTSAMLAQAKSIAAVDKAMLDADSMAFNLRNGTLVFRRVEDPENPDETSVRYVADIEVRGHERLDYMTRRAEVEYDASATCPIFDDYLKTAHPDPAIRQFLQVFYAQAIMLGGNDEQKILFHYGTGGEGKTTLNEVMGDLAGEYRATVSPDTISGEGARQGQQASPDIARLFNARFVTVDELQRGVPLRENMLKSLSGGTKQTARFLQQEIFEFTPQFTAVLSGNDMPQTSGLDDGLWRRLLIVHWTVKIPEDEKVNYGEFKRRLEAERPGILNWLIAGLKLYLAHGLDPYIPASVRKFTASLRTDRDIVGQFTTACVKRTGEAHDQVQGKDMYDAFVHWCEANGIKAWTNRAFGDRMAAMGFEKESGRLVYYLGVKLGDVPSKFDPKTPQPDPDSDPGPVHPEDL